MLITMASAEIIQNLMEKYKRASSLKLLHATELSQCRKPYDRLIIQILFSHLSWIQVRRLEGGEFIL